MKRVAELDGWRGVAVLALLAGHFVPHLGTDAPRWGINLGRVGVELFFALSGCLIGGLLFTQQMPLATFAARRFARIVPSMWLLLAVVVVLTALRGAQTPVAIMAAALGVSNFLPSLHLAVPIQYAHLWSVGLELQGYAVLGLLVWTARRTHWSAVMLLMSLVAASWLLTAARSFANAPLEYYAVFWRPEYRLTSMLLSAALVHGHDTGAFSLARFRSWIPWLVLGLLLQTHIVPDALKYTIGAACISLACAMIARVPSPSTGWMRHRVLVACGGASYSIYLWQQPFYSETGLVGWPAGLIMAIGTGFVADRVWDGPLHRWFAAIVGGRIGGRGDAVELPEAHS